MIEAAAGNLTDADASTAAELFPRLKQDGSLVSAGTRINWYGKVKRAAVATIGTSAAMGDVNWVLVGSASLLEGILSILTSVAGLPEVKAE